MLYWGYIEGENKLMRNFLNFGCWDLNLIILYVDLINYFLFILSFFEWIYIYYVFFYLFWI